MSNALLCSILLYMYTVCSTGSLLKMQLWGKVLVWGGSLSGTSCFSCTCFKCAIDKLWAGESGFLQSGKRKNSIQSKYWNAEYNKKTSVGTCFEMSSLADPWEMVNSRHYLDVVGFGRSHDIDQRFSNGGHDPISGGPHRDSNENTGDGEIASNPGAIQKSESC